MPTFNTEGTPNPNSLKITTDAGPFIDDGMATFSSREEAADDTLGAPLMSIDGVSNVFALPQFLTITKDPTADWNDLLPRVEAMLTAYFHERR